MHRKSHNNLKFKFLYYKKNIHPLSPSQNIGHIAKYNMCVNPRAFRRNKFIHYIRPVLSLCGLMRRKQKWSVACSLKELFLLYTLVRPTRNLEQSSDLKVHFVRRTSNLKLMTNSMVRYHISVNKCFPPDYLHLFCRYPSISPLMSRYYLPNKPNTLNGLQFGCFNCYDRLKCSMALLKWKYLNIWRQMNTYHVSVLQYKLLSNTWSWTHGVIFVRRETHVNTYSN